ncbi:hypothetical protein, partial [Enterococcus casseliflavus]|uniref:hypothetical protein n=1 Tax=Enterococcus casseliflavus TaxID=37734 RepID=UPI003D0E3864
KLGVFAALVAGAILLRRRSPAASLALAFFVLALLPHLNLLALARVAFAERSGYAAAAAFPLLACALADRWLGPQRRGV